MRCLWSHNNDWKINLCNDRRSTIQFFKWNLMLVFLIRIDFLLFSSVAINAFLTTVCRECGMISFIPWQLHWKCRNNDRLANYNRIEDDFVEHVQFHACYVLVSLRRNEKIFYFCLTFDLSRQINWNDFLFSFQISSECIHETWQNHEEIFYWKFSSGIQQIN